MNHNIYKQKIRRTLILSAILPVFLLTLIGLLAYYAIYIMKTNHELNQANKQIVHILEKHEADIKAQFELFTKAIPEDDVKVYRELYKRSTVNKENYLFKLDYKQQYTNDYTHTNSVPLYNKHGTYSGTPYELKVSLPISSLIQDSTYHYVITDKYDNIYYSSNHHDRYAVGEKYQYNEQTQLTSFYQNDKLKIYIYHDLSQTLDKGIMLIWILLLTFILLILITLYTSKLLSKRQTQDIDEIISHIRQAQVRALTHYEPLAAPSELEIINRYVYELSQRNERLLKFTKDSNEALKHAQLKALEHQFQPHFIFNTMQTINYMIDSDKKAAKKMMIKLSSILRYALRVEESEVTFRKEIAYLEDYLYIQNIRFDDCIHFSIDIDEDLLDKQTDKLLIQPLIENAIKYGGLEKGLNIKVRIRQLSSKDVCITVYDDGAGMTPLRLHTVRRLVRGHQLRNMHIGLQNIHQTLRVKYGSHYGMKIYSRSGCGTLIVLRVKQGGSYV